VSSSSTPTASGSIHHTMPAALLPLLHAPLVPPPPEPPRIRAPPPFSSARLSSFFPQVELCSGHHCRHLEPHGDNPSRRTPTPIKPSNRSAPSPLCSSATLRHQKPPELSELQVFPNLAGPSASHSILDFKFLINTFMLRMIVH
jgi:hypothetical protein